MARVGRDGLHVPASTSPLTAAEAGDRHFCTTRVNSRAGSAMSRAGSAMSRAGSAMSGWVGVGGGAGLLVARTARGERVSVGNVAGSNHFDVSICGSVAFCNTLVPPSDSYPAVEEDQ